jgi:hypothetical protein
MTTAAAAAAAIAAATGSMSTGAATAIAAATGSMSTAAAAAYGLIDSVALLCWLAGAVLLLLRALHGLVRGCALLD